MSRTDKFTVRGAFYRAEARPDGERWMVIVFRNGSLATMTEFQGPPFALTDRALSVTFKAVRDLAEQGVWEPDATAHPWNARRNE